MSKQGDLYSLFQSAESGIWLILLTADFKLRFKCTRLAVVMLLVSLSHYLGLKYVLLLSQAS